MLRLRDIQRRFDHAAPDFDDADFVHAVTRDGMLGTTRTAAVATGNHSRPGVRNRRNGAHASPAFQTGALRITRPQSRHAWCGTQAPAMVFALDLRAGRCRTAAVRRRVVRYGRIQPAVALDARSSGCFRAGFTRPERRRCVCLRHAGARQSSGARTGLGWD